MDWSLVLLTAEIPSTILQEEDGWKLAVSEEHYATALQTLELYRRENRFFRLPQIKGRPFHISPVSVAWIAPLVAVHFFSAGKVLDASKGVVDSHAISLGQWWRLGTGILLHADLSHLFANLATGFVFFNLAADRFRAGPVLLASFLAAALANLIGFLVYPSMHRSLGASGMVLACLGILSFPRSGTASGNSLLKAGFAGGVLLLVLLGFSPQSDIIAHVGGFIFGLVFGWMLDRVSRNRLDQVNGMALFLSALLGAALVALMSTR